MAAVDDSTELPPMLRGASRRGRRTYGISVPQRRSRRLQKSLPEYGRLPSPRRRRSAATEQTEPSDVAKPVSVSQARALAARRLSQVRRGVTRYTGFGRTPKAGREQGKNRPGKRNISYPLQLCRRLPRKIPARTRTRSRSRSRSRSRIRTRPLAKAQDADVASLMHTNLTELHGGLTLSE